MRVGWHAQRDGMPNPIESLAAYRSSPECRGGHSTRGAASALDSHTGPRLRRSNGAMTSGAGGAATTNTRASAATAISNAAKGANCRCRYRCGWVVVIVFDRVRQRPGDYGRQLCTRGLTCVCTGRRSVMPIRHQVCRYATCRYCMQGQVQALTRRGAMLLVM